MRLAYIWFEIVYVLNDTHLLDAESYQRSYKRRDGMPLDKGYYFVCWPPGGDTSRFDTDAVFHGPFMRRRDAITNMSRLQSLLLANDQKLFHAGQPKLRAQDINPDHAEHRQLHSSE